MTQTGNNDKISRDAKVNARFTPTVRIEEMYSGGHITRPYGNNDGTSVHIRALFIQ